MAQINAFGYREELRRSMGGFSTFAISFSLISVLTGIFANFNFGYQHAGGAVIWTWLLVAAGQFIVALVMANLSIRFPIAGYGYQWAARLVNPHFGFFVGWMLLVQFITGFPGICQTFAVTLIGLSGVTAGKEWILAGTVGIISLVALIHLLGIKFASRVNDLGVFAELIGVVFLLLLLLVFFVAGKQGRDMDVSNAIKPLLSLSLPFSSLALSMLLGAWCLTGFEAASDLSEETKAPATSVPRAVVSSLVISGISGFLIILLLVLHAGRHPASGQGNDYLLRILENTIGQRLTSVLLLFILLSIFACAVAAMATASRLLFSLSRDRILPFSGWISRVDTQTQTPRNAILLIWGMSICVVVFFQRIEMVTNISALASYIGYAGIMLSTLIGNIPPSGMSWFYPARWERPLQLMAFAWTLLVAAALSVPETRIEGFETRHLPAISTGFAILAGILLYIAYVRKRIRSGKAGPPGVHSN